MPGRRQGSTEQDGGIVEGGEVRAGDEIHEGSEMQEGSELLSAATSGAARRAPARGAAAGRPLSPVLATSPVWLDASGNDIVRIARQHVGERHVFGTRVPMANPAWKGPWDCAGFVSWCVHRASGFLFGTRPRNDPVLADACTGHWHEQAAAAGALVSVEQAATIEGAAILRIAAVGQTGHIVFSDGRGGTVEAHGTKLGVVTASLSSRRWDCGILVPGVRYLSGTEAATIAAAPGTLRLTRPMMSGKPVAEVQKRLGRLDFPVGRADGIFGPQTAHAVAAFQASEGLVADGEVGPLTLKAMGIS